MKGDFSRFSFDRQKHYRGVLMQQGRVQLDADWNEQADILLHLIGTQLNDLLGPGATAATEPGFAITLVEAAEEPADQAQGGQPEEPTAPASTLPDFQIGAGRYYVDGILCENEAPVLFSRQPDYPDAESPLRKPVDVDHLLVYLDVWQRHVTAIEDPAIREIALSGPDTTTRVKTVWQVKLLLLSGDPADDQGWCDRGGLRSLAEWKEFVAHESQTGLLKARWNGQEDTVLENRLYRVEIHAIADGVVTFKWSRENGSVVCPVFPETTDQRDADATALRVSVYEGNAEQFLGLGVRDADLDSHRLQEGSWVELVDEVTVLSGRTLPLCKVGELDRSQRSIKLLPEEGEKEEFIKAMHEERQLRLLRRWEAKANPIVRAESTATDPSGGWLDLENGLQVAFSGKGTYQVGDYWLIPARTRAKDGIEWPQKDGQPLAQPPHGITHHYAPLALLQFQDGAWSVQTEDCTAFRSLPHVTADLSALVEQLHNIQETTDNRIEKAFSLVRNVQKTVGTLARQTHVFETVKSEISLEKGDLVSLDRAAVEHMSANDPGMELPVKLASSKERHEKLVVGVVTEPMGNQRCRVAIFGRVRCKVIGRVEPGDLLVPSPELGHAQKRGWFFRTGPVIGRALSSTAFDEGKQTGTIDMLVTLG